MNPQELVGTPYVKLNCYELVRECAEKCYGIVYPLLPEFVADPKKVVAQQISSGNWVEVPAAKRRVGDVMSLSPTKGDAGHVGIVIAGGYVLHNDKKYGALIQDEVGLRKRGYVYRHVYRWVK